MALLTNWKVWVPDDKVYRFVSQEAFPTVYPGTTDSILNPANEVSIVGYDITQYTSDKYVVLNTSQVLESKADVDAHLDNNPTHVVVPAFQNIEGEVEVPAINASNLSVFKGTDASQTEQTTDYVSVTGLAGSTGEYQDGDELIITASFDWNIENKGKDITAKIMFDGVVLGELGDSGYSFRSSSSSDGGNMDGTGSDQWMPFHRSYSVTVSGTGIKAVDIQFRGDDSTKKITIGNALYLVRKTS